MDQRFLNKIIPEPNSGCWLWDAAISNNYGHYNNKGAHRVSYETFKGPIPKGLHVLHKCDVPSCVNPDHLFLGTPLDNMIDKVRKGRWKGGHLGLTGESNGRSKITKDDAISIFNDNRLHTEIAKEYGISSNQVSLIKMKKSWRQIHVT